MEPPPPPPVALMDELVEDIILRIPPDDPARLLDAALVCKRWCRIVSDSGFRRRYREFHRTPPILGFIRNHRRASSFVSTSSFRAPPADGVNNSRAIDARHGRVLLYIRGRSDRALWEWEWDGALHVWDPITGERRELPVLPPGPVEPSSWNAAVLCAIDGCQHLDCHRGPFQVVFVGGERDCQTFGVCAYVYSSETDAWSNQISTTKLNETIYLVPSALAQNVLYFQCLHSVLKYDLATQELSLIMLPRECLILGRSLLMATEDGGVGLAYICPRRRSLYLWSWKGGPDNGEGWARKVIKLTSLLPAHDDSLGPMTLTGFAHGHDVFFVRTSVGIFTVDLKFIHATKVYEENWCDESFPYMSFCTPALGAASAEGSKTGTSKCLIK